MKPEVLKALKSSIEHWERLASGKRKPNEEVSVLDCDLCKLFNTPVHDNDKKCIGCPVFEKTKKQFCYGTPFTVAENLTDENEDGVQMGLDSEEFQDAAQKELEFLKSLLPKNE